MNWSDHRIVEIIGHKVVSGGMPKPALDHMPTHMCTPPLVKLRRFCQQPMKRTTWLQSCVQFEDTAPCAGTHTLVSANRCSEWPTRPPACLHRLQLQASSLMQATARDHLSRFVITRRFRSWMFVCRCKNLRVHHL